MVGRAQARRDAAYVVATYPEEGTDFYVDTTFTVYWDAIDVPGDADVHLKVWNGETFFTFYDGYTGAFGPGGAYIDLGQSTANTAEDPIRIWLRVRKTDGSVTYAEQLFTVLYTGYPAP